MLVLVGLFVCWMVGVVCACVSKCVRACLQVHTQTKDTCVSVHLRICVCCKIMDAGLRMLVSGFEGQLDRQVGR